MIKVILIIILVLVFAYVFLRPSTDTKSGKVAIFSAFKGQITLKGAPLEGVKLTRTYPKIGKTDEVSETVYTDKNGYYSFEEITGSLGIMKFLPHEAVIHQSIKAQYLNKEYLLWYTCKRNYDTLGELKYNKSVPHLQINMLAAYKKGYILLDGDLESSEDFIQRINSHVSFISISDLKFPYEDALKSYAEKLVTRKDEFTKEIGRWFEAHPDFLTSSIGDESNWSEMELPGITPYKNAVIKSVDSIEYNEDVKLEYYENDFILSSMRVTVSGGVILNVENPDGTKFKARVWLFDSLFSVGKNSVEFLGQEHYFMINSANIDPNNND